MKKELASIAKITKPRLPKVLNRTRLFGFLDKGRHTSVTWVNGPAGSGKTTLIASWIEARQLPCLWYQMDGGDADLATFFYYLGLAAKKAAPRFRKPLHLLTPEYMMDVPTFSRRYFEDLCVRVKTPFLIIFDNYQEVPPDSLLHAVLASGVAAIPEGVRVVCLSRTEPPSTYSGLIAGSKMEIIGWDDLRLRPDESRAIVGLHSEDKQPRKTLEWMYNRTQGWAAGLVLLARAVKNQIINPETIDAFTPVNVFDYFVHELFGRLDKPTQDFLLKTAFMPKFTPRLAEDLTGNKNAVQILSELNRNNYFTEKRLQPELSYQYHALFRDFLRSHAQKLFSDTERNRLRIEAATLLQKAEMWEDAADVYLEAGAWGSLVSLALGHAHTLLDQGRSRTLHKWLASLPEAIKTTDPWVLYWLGICDMAFQPQQSHKSFEEAFELFTAQSNDVGRLLAWSGAADVAMYSGKFAGLGDWLKRIEGLDVGDASFLEPRIAARVTFSIFNAMVYGFPGHRDIRQWTERITDVLYRAQDVNIDFQVQARVTLGVYYGWKGDFFNGRIILDYLNDLCKRKTLSDLSVLSVLTYNALYGCTAGDLGLALKSMDEALHLLIRAEFMSGTTI